MCTMLADLTSGELLRIILSMIEKLIRSKGNEHTAGLSEVVKELATSG